MQLATRKTKKVRIIRLLPGMPGVPGSPGVPGGPLIKIEKNKQRNTSILYCKKKMSLLSILTSNGLSVFGGIPISIQH